MKYFRSGGQLSFYLADANLKSYHSQLPLNQIVKKYVIGFWPNEIVENK